MNVVTDYKPDKLNGLKLINFIDLSLLPSDIYLTDFINNEEEFYYDTYISATLEPIRLKLKCNKNTHLNCIDCKLLPFMCAGIKHNCTLISKEKL